jgi:CRP/FNR family cyclic AMP-dependent transcriptional regulator
MDWLLLRSLKGPEKEAVLAAAARHRYRRGDVLFHEGDLGDSVHLLEAGRVAVRTNTPDGDTVTYAISGPGEAFGELGLLARDHRRTATVVALEPVETLVLRREQFERVRLRHPGVDRMLVEILAQRVRRLSAHLVEALYVPVDKRVVRRLLALCRQYADNGASHVSLPLTQSELAEMAGATRPTVNKVLRTLEDAAVIGLARGSIEVLDRETLRRHAR